MAPEVLKKTLVESAERGVAEFNGKVEVLLDLLRTRFPPQILATLSGWGLIVGVSAAGTAEESVVPRIQQHHLEVLQALALKLPEHEWGREAASPAEIQVVLDMLVEVTDIFHQQRLVALREERNLQEHTVLALQERLRANTQIVRNWGYFSEVVRIATELYTPLDPGLRAHHGFRASDLIEVARQILATYEERINERYSSLRKALRPRSVRKLVRQYFKRFVGIKGGPKEYFASLSPKATVEEKRTRILAHADRGLVTLARVDLAQISVRSGRDLETVRRILNVLSLRPGDLCSSRAEHLFLSNPVWHAPGVRIGDEYFFAMPQVVFSFIHPILRRLIEDAKLKKELDKRRADFLEEEVARIVRTALPQGHTRTGKAWRWAGQQYETDVLTTFDRVLLIAEAKSASLTPEGLRGAPDRVRRHVQELVVAPSQQSARLQEILQLAKNGNKEAQRVAQSLELDPMKLDTFIRVSVTLDDFSVLSSAEGELAAAGWKPADFELAPTVNLADFVCVAEVLDSPIRFIHYFSERGRIQRAAEIFGDELDYLGFYLETGFNAWRVEGGEYRLLINGMSRGVDHYFTSRDAGVIVPKPRPKSEPYFEALIAKLSQSSFEAWTTIALAILRGVNVGEQKEAVRAFEKLRREVPRTYQDPHHVCSVQIVPPPTRDALLLFFVYPPELAEQRHTIVDQLVDEAFEQTKRRQCVFIGRRTDGWNEPYQFIGLATAPKT